MQTALNAVLCALEAQHERRRELGLGSGNDNNLRADVLCADRIEVSLSARFDDQWAGASPLQPTGDPLDWNDLTFFTRRRHPHQPYADLLQRRHGSQRQAAGGLPCCGDVGGTVNEAGWF